MLYFKCQHQHLWLSYEIASMIIAIIECHFVIPLTMCVQLIHLKVEKEPNIPIQPYTLRNKGTSVHPKMSQ